MSKEYSQQHITLFFEQFRKLENSFTIEKVHLIINNPNARARYKVKNVKPINLIIMTFLISISIVLALLFSSPGSKQENRAKQANQTIEKDIAVLEENGIQTDVSELGNNEQKEFEAEQEPDITNTLNPVLDKNEPEVTKKEKSVLSDNVIDGSKFILELTNEELEKLGFQINHYAIYYRNSFRNMKIFYLSTHQNGGFYVMQDSTRHKMNDYYPLQIDTISQNATIKLVNTIALGKVHPPKIKWDDIVYSKSEYSFYPLFNTYQSGEIEKIKDDLNFEEMADTLIPIVILSSQFDLENKRDQFFWFLTNDDFYTSLPERYSWVKEEFKVLKEEKRLRQDKFRVDFKTEDWNKDLLISENLVLDGQDYIVQFTREELEKVGVFKKDNNRWFYHHNTPCSGSACGLITEIVDGKIEIKSDTILNTDYYIKYSTDCTGDFLVNGTTIKRMDEFFNDNDILLPVQVENRDGEIYWFTLSENFWKLVPERYQNLKAHYNKMLYNKSIAPNRDFVIYFKEPFKKVGIDVPLIELTKEELENIGFIYVNGGAEINCGFGKNWIQFKFEDHNLNRNLKLPEKIRKMLEKSPTPVFEHLHFISPNKRFIKQEWIDKFDSLFSASNQGYQFVYITDSLGRHMHKINIKKEDIQINGEDFKFLIPIIVRNSKIATSNSEDRVFWFTPTEAFFDRLPDRIKNDLKEEYEIVSSEGKSAGLSSCTYFESCRSTLKVGNLKIYPNPAQSEITIDFNLDIAQEGEIALANIAGQQIKLLKSKLSFDEGFNSIKCQLEGINPGIYLISIVTDSGYMTERIIISE
ncbi:MAG: T9SS type A sorting domain-containing protein [Prolixibacteraceae bacterium]|nr:T9SS type A sorting domain-containing protein [Prolixibacteraceae bacterium]